MSNIIRCDKCGRYMYADSCGNKDDYAQIDITYIDGYSTYHVCKACFRQFFTEFMRTLPARRIDETFGEVSNG